MIILFMRLDAPLLSLKNKLMKKPILIIALLFAHQLFYAQVGGLSASKLAALCVETVPVKSIEFEPAITYSITNKHWDNSSKLLFDFQNNDTLNSSAELGFRMTYGVLKNLEAGISFPVNMRTVQFGLKYKLPVKYKKIQLGIFAGANFFTGKGVKIKNKNSIKNTDTYVSGLILSYQVLKNLSMDFNFEYQHLTKSVVEKHDHDIILNTDIGYYINDIQLVLGLNYIQSNFTLADYSYYSLSLNPGVTIERAKNFILVLNFPYDIHGKNTCKSFGCALALTIMID